MNSILKYTIVPADTFEFDMPLDAKILSVQVQPPSMQPQLWACGRADNPLRETRVFRLLATGQTFKEALFTVYEEARRAAVEHGVALLYVGTFQITNEARPMVFHLFEQLNGRDPSIKVAKRS